MKVLITGGSGFIGTNLVEALLDRGYDVLSLDISPPVNKKHVSVYQYCDIRDYDSLYEQFVHYSPEIVVHLAARTDLDGRTLDDYSSNILGVVNVCRVVEKVTSIKKTLFASSMLVCRAQYIPVDVNDFSPNTLYGESKVEGEKIVRDASARLGDFVIFRPTSIWGPWFKMPYRNYFDMVLGCRFFDIDGGFCKKTYGYVVNAVNQIESLMMVDIDLQNKLVYIGDSNAVEISNWASLIALNADLPPPRKLPRSLFKAAAFLGDALKLIGANFPLTSFRLNNMLTDNVVDCSVATSLNIYKEVDLKEATIDTLQWINLNEK
ncbi:TPA: NAD(P)-dependent oxidoreductase [Vibrio campbellii]|nr:NAD(P)-dependent oxidoreductase [Vibrio campbellii]HDM8241329.1 NAD(P)-dependent oxidoreductase [Vibrio campbellii]